MAKNEKKNDISKLSFEQAIKELTTIVGKIEQGEIPLQDSLEQYERAMTLIKHCRSILQNAENAIVNQAIIDRIVCKALGFPIKFVEAGARAKPQKTGSVLKYTLDKIVTDAGTIIHPISKRAPLFHFRINPLHSVTGSTEPKETAVIFE